MMQATEPLAVNRSITVQAPPERAFAVFTEGFDSWWPRGHHIGSADMAKAVIDPYAGGRWYELGEDDSRTDWGDVLAYDPPHRLVLTWHIGGTWSLEASPENFSEIEVTFTPEGDGTRVELAHRHLERHTAAASLAESVGGDGGWNGLLKLYSEAVG